MSEAELFEWGMSGSGGANGIYPIFCARCRSVVALVLRGAMTEQRMMFLTGLALRIAAGQAVHVHGFAAHPDGFQPIWDVALTDQRLTEQEFYAYLHAAHPCRPSP